ncbi:MAG: phosphatidylserine decarboxylase [Pseudomonadota bacterium]
MRHQYLERHTGRVREERPFGDRLVRMLYGGLRENSQGLFKAFTSPRFSGLLGILNYDSLLGARLAGGPQFLRRAGVDLGECLDDPVSLNTPRKIFERRIGYWDCRPLEDEPAAVAAPADSRVLLGSFRRQDSLFLKGKFFSFDELLGPDSQGWRQALAGGDWAVFRLTPEKYHYNHAPVSGRVLDIYKVDGAHHSCNPSAVVSMVTPFSKNQRVVTILDTDVPGGSGCGLVAMVEVVALMIGRIEQAYSAQAYDDPQDIIPGLMLQKGQPKSLFRPGSSTVVLLFQPGRVAFCPDLLRNQVATHVHSRFARGFGRPLTETEVLVRSTIARAIKPANLEQVA